MIKIVGIEFIPHLGNGRPKNGIGTFVETLVYRAHKLWVDVQIDSQSAGWLISVSLDDSASF
jgi:hypothetical protein